MTKIVKLRRGLNIELKGSAEKVLGKLPLANKYYVCPEDFRGFIPHLCVKEGDIVKAGTAIFNDKDRPEIIFPSPVSGKVTAINRGERRKLLNIEITPDSEQIAEKYEITPEILKSKEQIKNLMLQAGFWPIIKQRPFGTIADPNKTPKAIFISGFDTSPLPVDMDFIISGSISYFQTGIDILSKLTDGKIHLGLHVNDTGAKLNKIKKVELTYYSGKHPASNVGVHIHHNSPIGKGDVIWTINPQHVASLGKFFTTGIFNADRIIAVCGSSVKRPQYYRVTSGMSSSFMADQINSDNVRIISGNVLTGKNVGINGCLSYYSDSITAIPEEKEHQFIGWVMPNLNKFSMSRSYFSWLLPNKKYELGTNFHGGERAFVVNGQYEKVLPMDLYPVYLLKAIWADDIDNMELHGIYEVIEEDLALCEYVCTSKIEVQSLLGKGIEMMMKEM